MPSQAAKPSSVSEHANASEAIAWILRGDVEQGFALYERSLRGDNLPDAPAGIHVGMLEEAGRSNDAERLRRLAVRYSADLAPRAGSFLGADPEEAAREYESLFDRGLINSRMIHKYLKVLAELGRMDEHRRILAPELLFEEAMLDPALAAAADAMLLDLEEEAEQQESVQSVRNMRMLSGLSQLDHETAKALIGEISAHTEAYLRRWRSADHPFAHFVSDDIVIQAWGLISRGEGYNIPHIHGEGWATGIFYPRSVAGSGGDLVIGRPKNAAGTDEDWGARSVKPETGLLILIPSYYTHWTVPLAGPGLRTSVAFDVVRA